MCDFSLHNVKSRPAKVGDKLTTHNFITGTCGFAAPEDSTTAVCILPGTELAFSAEVICASSGLFGWRTISSRTAIFRQIDKDIPQAHHDALEFPDGTFVLLTDLDEDQQPTVLQLPAQPKTPAEARAQTRVVYVGCRSTDNTTEPRAVGLPAALPVCPLGAPYRRLMRRSCPHAADIPTYA